MIDPSEHLINIKDLAGRLEELLAYARPAPEQVEEIRALSLRITTVAMRLHVMYPADQEPWRPTPPRQGSCGC